jgi:hypothetical protein
MDPSVIFLIVAGAILFIGRTINRIAERSGNDVDDTTQSFDAQHQFDGEEAIPARQNTSEEDTLADTILAQILAEKHRKEIRERMLQTMNPTQTHAPRFVSNASVAPKTQKVNKAKAQPKMQPKTPQKESKFEDNDTRTSNILEDFDVKKAFIYSEILNTKFDE